MQPWGVRTAMDLFFFLQSVFWETPYCTVYAENENDDYGDGDGDLDDDENYQKNICMNTIPPPYADPSSIGAMPI